MPDDALAIGALSSATFMMDWAYLHADQPAPDVEGTVAGLRNLVLGMRAEAEARILTSRRPLRTAKILPRTRALTRRCAG